MDSTNNEIYKIAKYLDKYTKYGNKEGGVYLQKLDNYLHKVQYGGNGVVQLAEEIGKIVTEVVDKHKKVKGELERLLEGDSVEAKVSSLQEQISGLEERIARKKAIPPPEAAAASSAPEAITFETLSRENITTIAGTDLAKIIYKLANEHAKEIISEESILQLVSDVIYLQILQIIEDVDVDIKQNYGSLTAAKILKIIYASNIFDDLPKDYKTTILFIEITIAILKIKEKILGDTRDEILELEKIVTGILRSSTDKCKEFVNELFIEYVNSNESSELILHISFIEYYENDWRYRIACTANNDFPQVITAKEVCRRLDIDEQIKEEIITHPTQILTWNMYKDWTIVFVIYMFYNRPKPYDVVNEVFKDTENAIVALKVAQQLMYMKFDAIEIREGTEVDEVEMRKVIRVSDIISHLEKNKSDIAIFKEYVKDAQEKETGYIHLNIFKDFKKQRISAAAGPASTSAATSPAPVSASALAHASTATSPAPVSASALAHASTAGPASSPASSALASSDRRDIVLPSPVSKKFDIVGFTITKDFKTSSYAIPDDQKEKVLEVLEVLPPDLKKKLKSNDVKLSRDHIKARIEFNDDLPIKDILRKINERENPQPTKFLTTDPKLGNSFNVWLFIVPITYKIDEKTNETDRQYLDAINKLTENEFKKIASIMEGIKKIYVQQSPRGSAVRASVGQSQSTNDRGGQAGSMSSRGPYRHPSTPPTPNP
jgi:hypothetical protein